MKKRKYFTLIGAAGMLMVLLTSRADAAVLITEMLADPPAGLAGDANQDGVRNSSQDEFIELLNSGDSYVDLSFWTISDNASTRHVFGNGTVLNAHERLIIFGGGSLNQFPYTAVLASSGSLSLNNSGDSITLADANAKAIDSIVYGSEAGQNESLQRLFDQPGVFALHSSISTAGLAFSPGTDPDGSLFEPTIATPESHTPVMAPEPATSVLLGLSTISYAFLKKRGRLTNGAKLNGPKELS